MNPQNWSPALTSTIVIIWIVSYAFHLVTSVVLIKYTLYNVQSSKALSCY